MFLINLHGLVVRATLFPAHGMAWFAMAPWPTSQHEGLLGRFSWRMSQGVAVAVTMAVVGLPWAPTTASQEEGSPAPGTSLLRGGDSAGAQGSALWKVCWKEIWRQVTKTTSRVIWRTLKKLYITTSHSAQIPVATVRQELSFLPSLSKPSLLGCCKTKESTSATWPFCEGQEHCWRCRSSPLASVQTVHTHAPPNRSTRHLTQGTPWLLLKA